MSDRRWRWPRWYAVVLTVLGIALFVRLGFWQLDRAAEKATLLGAFATAARQPAQDFADVRDANDAQHFPHVRITGRFLPERGYLLDEQMRQGQAGVHAIGVFAVDSEPRLLLVDRGWLAWNHAAGSAPRVAQLPQGALELRGIYAPFPGGGLRIGGNALTGQTQWPKLTLYLDPGALAADLGKDLLPRMLLLDPAPDSGFAREWTPNVMPPERHRAYAFQWFALACAVLATFVIVHWRKKSENKTR